MGEIGRTGWFVFGAVAMAIAGAAHAVSSVTHIGRDLVRAPHPAEQGSATASGSSGLLVDSGPGGWILFGGLVLAGTGIYHLIAGIREIIGEILHAPPAR